MGPDNFYSMRKNDDGTKFRVSEELGALKNTHTALLEIMKPPSSQSPINTINPNTVNAFH